MTVKQPKQPNYKVKWSIGKEVYNSSGNTLEEAIKKIKPKSYMGVGSIEVSRGEKVSRIPFKMVPIKTQRLFEKPLEQALFIKRLKTLI